MIIVEPFLMIIYIVENGSNKYELLGIELIAAHELNYIRIRVGSRFSLGM